MRLSWVRHRPSLGVHLVSFWYGFFYYFFSFHVLLQAFWPYQDKIKTSGNNKKKDNNEKPKKLSQMNWKEGIFDFLIHSRNVRLAQWIIARSPWVQGSKGPRVQGSKDSRVSKGPKVQGFKISSSCIILGFEFYWIYLFIYSFRVLLQTSCLFF